MPRGKHRAGYRKPRTGEQRQQRKPLLLDRDPQAQDLVQKHFAAGDTWEQIGGRLCQRAGEALTPASIKKWTLRARRWWDLRVEQVQAQVYAQDVRAEKNLRRYFGKTLEQLPEAAVHALKAQVFGMQEARSPEENEKAVGGFLFLLSRVITAQTGQKKLGLEEEKLKLAAQRLEQMRSKIGGLKEAVAGKKKVSSEELVKQLDQIYGLTQPNA